MSAARRVRDGASVAEDGLASTHVPESAEIAQAGSAGDFCLFSDAVALLPREYRGLVVGYLSRAWHEAADLAALVERLTEELAALRPSPSRSDRLHLRDETIRAAFLQHPYANLSPSAAAKELARALGAYLSGGWLREQHLDHLPNASEHRQTLHKIARLNGGRSVGWRQLVNVKDGFRSY